MKPLSCVAFTVIRYVVAPHQPEPSEFYSEADAARAAKSAVRRLGVVRLYRVEGEPVTGIWRAPLLVATYGPAPTISPA